MEEELDKKYRPTELHQVIGQNETVNVLKDLYKDNKLPHSIIFAGPTGTGKTTLARIIAKLVDCEDILEIDGSTFTGKDDMTDIAVSLKFKSIIGNGKKLLILDEAHGLSTKAWNSWLKLVEEPPEHLYFVFCTTEFHKIIATIKNRCHTFKLKELTNYEMEVILKNVIEKENITLPKHSLSLLIKESYGCPRQALVYLSQVRKCIDFDAVASIIGATENSIGTMELCRFLVGGGTEKQLSEMLIKIKDMSPYSIKVNLSGYFISCVLNAKSEEQRVRFLNILDIISNMGDTFSHVVLGTFRILML